MWVVFCLVSGLLTIPVGSATVWAGAPYRLGMSAGFTGPSRGVGVELYRGAMAYFSFLNEGGGIDGRRVEIVSLDDGYQPTPAVENTIKFLEDDDILCLFNYVGTPTVTRVLPLIKGYEQHQKLLFFPFTGAEAQRRQPYRDSVYNLRPSYVSELDGLVEKFMAIGRMRLAVFYQADAYGRSGWDGAQKALAKSGRTLVGEATYRRGAKFEDSMQRQVDILMRSNPDAILSIGSYAACAAFIRDARDNGLDVPIANISFVSSEHLVSLLQKAEAERGAVYTDNLVNTQVVPDYADTSQPLVQEYRACMDRFAPPPSQVTDEPCPLYEYSSISFEGFLNARAMAHILAAYTEVSAHGIRWTDAFMNAVDRETCLTRLLRDELRQGVETIYFTTVSNGRLVPINEELWHAWHK
ncbi:ABC transporter substrate-binding protein [Pseudodesulfovibrio sp. JC047]|uniref:ABC transporter substrate-binding protein n=1 Tax=Pseudodesulfovibrio sp. JC047 TaxID=2683199 RepID=UPI0013D36BC1|nr:ABC transporter substrate-binding protein [Pseudodesulfovibrio sp. JC047]NDV18555.1 ABC transporter substrate-binding protein [Pseudodesulfovibrio sp. JC047]